MMNYPTLQKKNTDILAIYFRTNPGYQGGSNKQLERCLTFSSRRKTEKETNMYIGAHVFLSKT